MDFAIRTADLCKNYGMRQALTNINFSVRESVIYGLVGPNGSGKTTSMNLLTGLLRASHGRIYLLGREFTSKNSCAIKSEIGVVTEDLALFDHLHADEQLYFSARIYGLDRRTALERLHELFIAFDLYGQRQMWIHEYSKGMKKKLAFMCAIIHDPRILFIDELFDGLDPVSSGMIQDIIMRMAAKGTTVFMTSHNLSLIEKVCMEVGILKEGQLIYQDAVQTMSNDNLPGCLAGLTELFHQLVNPEPGEVTLSWL
ncbi:ABC transporter ATP-binding protein [bacterium]|nr:ABC transporter ATP-binding protein [bacterium]